MRWRQWTWKHRREVGTFVYAVSSRYQLFGRSRWRALLKLGSLELGAATSVAMTLGRRNHGRRKATTCFMHFWLPARHRRPSVGQRRPGVSGGEGQTNFNAFFWRELCRGTP